MIHKDESRTESDSVSFGESYLTLVAFLVKTKTDRGRTKKHKNNENYKDGRFGQEF